MFKYHFIALLALLAGCQKKQSPNSEERVLALKTMGQLASSEYLVTKIVKASDNKTWFKWGSRKILLSCQASVKAGVDLSSLNAENIETNGQQIILYLPPPKILTVSIPPESVKIEQEDIGLFRTHFNHEEQNELMIQAEQQIRQVADSIGVIKAAGENARLFLHSYLRNLGFKEITIEFSNPEKKNKLD